MSKLFDKISVIIVDDYYTPEELELIQTEAKFLYPKLGDENKTSAATEVGPYGQRRKKRGQGVFVDEIFNDRRYSDILTVSRKLFHTPEILQTIGTVQRDEPDGLYWQMWGLMNYDTTLLQYYKNGDYYDYHSDHCQFTAITTLKFKFFESFSGGDLMFRDFGKEARYEAKHNSTIIFPSIVDHRVTEVFQNPTPSTDPSIFDYRWSIAHLISLKP